MSCDEMWVVYDNRRRSAQWLDHDGSLPNFPKTKLYGHKAVVIVWWCVAGLIHYNFFKSGETSGHKDFKQTDEMYQELL